MFYLTSSVMKDRLKGFKKSADIAFEKDGIVLNETIETIVEEIIQNPPFFLKKKVEKKISSKLNKSHMFCYEKSGLKFTINVKLFRRLLSEENIFLDVNKERLNIYAKLRKASFPEKTN